MTHEHEWHSASLKRDSTDSLATGTFNCKIKCHSVAHSLQHRSIFQIAVTDILEPRSAQGH